MSGKVIVAFWIEVAEFVDVFIVGLGGKNEEALFTLNQVKTTLRGYAAMMNDAPVTQMASPQAVGSTSGNIWQWEGV